jgi:predicted nucleic acid-binding protein
MHLVDSSILYSILLGEKSGEWARAKLSQLRSVGGVFINQIVFFEMCAFAESEQEAEDVLSPLVSRVDLPWSCAFPAGKAFKRYKLRGGPKKRMLADFLIAAHADALGWKLVTNSGSDIRSYFPELEIICPP